MNIGRRSPRGVKGTASVQQCDDEAIPIHLTSQFYRFSLSTLVSMLDDVGNGFVYSKLHGIDPSLREAG